MSELKHVSAFVDFAYPGPLLELASKLSAYLFADIRFVGLDEGIWDEVPAVRLEKDFLGLRVELGGQPGEAGGYTLQVEPFEFPWEEMAENHHADANVDLSGYARFLLKKIDGIEIRSHSFEES